jgi:hypothetical protein
MIDHDELYKAGVDALGDDAFIVHPDHISAIINAVEPLIRADERKSSVRSDITRRQITNSVVEKIAQALEVELVTHSLVSPSKYAPWKLPGTTRIHGQSEVRRDAANIARRFKEVSDA